MKTLVLTEEELHDLINLVEFAKETFLKEDSQEAMANYNIASRAFRKLKSFDK